MEIEQRQVDWILFVLVSNTAFPGIDTESHMPHREKYSRRPPKISASQYFNYKTPIRYQNKTSCSKTIPLDTLKGVECLCRVVRWQQKTRSGSAWTTMVEWVRHLQEKSISIHSAWLIIHSNIVYWSLENGVIIYFKMEMKTANWLVEGLGNQVNGNTATCHLIFVAFNRMRRLSGHSTTASRWRK